MEKKLSEISRSEWVAFNWIEIGGVMGDEAGDERIFMAENRRTPDEAAEAAMDWDSSIEAIEEMKGVEL